jgi:diaminopimelate epimerase
MSGAGNDFILINGATAKLDRDPGELARALCPRRTSIGADGLIVVEPSERADADLRVRFWNPDGSEPETCGNGTRCAARFAVLEDLAPGEMLMDTLGGDIGARISRASVALKFLTRVSIELDVTVRAGEVVSGHRLEIGNPHFVIPSESLPAGAIEPICRPVRYAPELDPPGANVHLAQVIDRHSIRIRTYERGVEAETLACGSGSMCSAVALAATGHVEPPVAVETRSGDVLTVRFQQSADGTVSDLELEGPAQIIYWGESNLNELTVPR